MSGLGWRCPAMLLHKPPLALVLTAGRVQSVLSLTAQWRDGAHFLGILEEQVKRSYGLLFFRDNSPISNDGSWSERWGKVLLDLWASCMAREMVCHIIAAQKGPSCLGSTSQEHQCSSLWSFGLEFTPWRHCLGQTPTSALAGGSCGEPPACLCLGMGSPCHAGRTAGHCRTAGCPHPTINVATIQHKVLAIVFSRHKGCPENNRNIKLASCSWCDTLSRVCHGGSMAFLHRIVVTVILAPWL